MELIKLGISTCLLGENVRYDGGHALDRFITETLGRYVEFVPVCPEVECGFDIPREAFRLVGDPDSPRFITVQTQKDFTARINKWAHKGVKQLEREKLCGFIFKSRSPSSGMERVKVYNDKGMPVKKGIGMFARAFMDHFHQFVFRGMLKGIAEASGNPIVWGPRRFTPKHLDVCSSLPNQN